MSSPTSNGSLAVSGVCLTAIDLDQLQPGQFAPARHGQTLRRTNLGVAWLGDAINLERCLPAGSLRRSRRAGNHVDAVGTRIRYCARGMGTHQLAHRPGTLLAEKGSIAVSGCL